MKTKRIAVVGLGYVGLPLAVEFGKTSAFQTIGFDVNSQKIGELRNGKDSMGEVSDEELADTHIEYTDNAEDLKKAECIIVAVPTPITKAKQPDLTLIRAASETIGKHLQPNAIVVFESTVYPGVTEEICVPILESVSGLTWKKDFFVGYSPERINPGDKEHTIDKIIKVVSGDTPETLEEVAEVYSQVCKAGVHKASSIKVAEAAKVIENIQRDLNIALVNELSLIFNKLDINTNEVIAAAATKWNFHSYTPGLVGGHCIGVDPYYLVYRAEELGYHPQVIAAGRRINDSMPEYVADWTVRSLIKAKKLVQGAKIVVVGLTFKENVKDIRNSKIFTTIKQLRELGAEVYAYDPLLEPEDISKRNITPVANLQDVTDADAVILSAVHSTVSDWTLQRFASLCKTSPIVIDIKGGLYSQRDSVKDLIYFSL